MEPRCNELLQAAAGKKIADRNDDAPASYYYYAENNETGEREVKSGDDNINNISQSSLESRKEWKVGEEESNRDICT